MLAIGVFAPPAKPSVIQPVGFVPALARAGGRWTSACQRGLRRAARLMVTGMAAAKAAWTAVMMTVVAVAGLLGTTVPAQAVDLPKGLALPGGRSSAGAPPAAATQPSIDEWRTRLAQAREVHERLARQPPGSEPLLAERQLTSSRLLTLLASQIEATREPAGDAGAVAPAPIRLAEPAPYNLVEVDALRDRLDDLRAQRAALQLSLVSQHGEVENAIANRTSANAQFNQRRDQASRPPAQDGAEPQAQVQLASLQAQIAALEVLQADTMRQRTQTRLAALDGPMALLDRELARVRGHQRLDPPTLARQLKALDVEALALTTEITRLEDRITQRSTAAVAAGSTRSLELDALTGAVTALRELQTLVRRQATAWRGRFDYLAGEQSLDSRRVLDATLAGALDQLATQQRSVADRHALLRIELRGRTGEGADGAARADAQRLLEAQQQKLDALQRLEESLRQSGVLLGRLREDLALDQRPQDMRGWLAHGLDIATAGIAAVWQHELFNATESTVIDGRIVTVDYGVTVGKSIGLLVILVIGYWAAGRLSHHVVNLLAQRLQLSAAFANVIRRWLSTILVLVVVLIVLRLARIPLTAFAFLGGALAIGVGFGTQTIIKNLISGVIILLERKIHVGDTVTIGGMSGTVMTVDFRATTVRGFDGVDAIVPNSQLLENQISNWSGGGPSVRRVVEVGVAYGCDVRRAAELVTACAQAHESVLAAPEPEVLLSNFGSDALTLRLLYWTRLGGIRGGPGVDSDLRFAIEQTLRQAGIGIAFPQRDVHLDLAGPVRVALVRAAAQPQPQPQPQPPTP